MKCQLAIGKESKLGLRRRQSYQGCFLLSAGAALSAFTLSTRHRSSPVPRSSNPPYRKERRPAIAAIRERSCYDEITQRRLPNLGSFFDVVQNERPFDSKYSNKKSDKAAASPKSITYQVVPFHPQPLLQCLIPIFIPNSEPLQAPGCQPA